MQWVGFPGLGINKIYICDSLFKLGNFRIATYSIIFCLAIIVGALFSFFMSEKFGVLKSKYVDVVIFSAFSGIIGARIYYVIFNFSVFFSNGSFFKNLVKIINLREGGLAFYGGLIFSTAVGIVVCIVEKIKIAPMLDLGGIGFFLGQSIGRWGNFFNVEAFGSKTSLPWGMTGSNIPKEFSPAHPTFLYESIWCFLGFLLLDFLRKRRKFDGELFLVYTMLYGLGRFFIEWLRTDSLMLFETRIRISQLLSFILFVGSVVCFVFYYFKLRSKKTELYVQTKDWQDELRLSKNNF